MKYLLSFAIVVAVLGCSKRPGPEPGDNSVTMGGREYRLVGGRYENFHNRITGDDALHLYIDLTDKASIESDPVVTARIILEASTALAGRKVAIEAGERFWFFSFGDARVPYTSFTNSRSDFGGHASWFHFEEQEGKCSLHFEVAANGELCAKGKISGVFTPVNPTQKN